MIVGGIESISVRVWQGKMFVIFRLTEQYVLAVDSPKSVRCLDSVIYRSQKLFSMGTHNVVEISTGKTCHVDAACWLFPDSFVKVPEVAPRIDKCACVVDAGH
jgi:hypothetical protein